MAYILYSGPGIWVGAPGEHTWWFHHGNWQPGQWLRASMIAKHTSTYEGCHVFKATVQILEEWTETITDEDCGDLRPEKVSVVHWVRFKVTGFPGQAFESITVQPRFLVVS